MKKTLLLALAAGWAGLCLAQPVPLRETAPLKAGGLQYFNTAQLPDGDVLVFGGTITLPNTLTGVWRYDWQTETWSTANPLAFAAAQTTDVTLSNGNILCIGGTNNFGNPLQKSQLLDINTMTWSESAGSFSFFNPVYSGISALALPGDYVILTTSNGDFSVYNPGTKQWSDQDAPAPLDAGGFPMVWLGAQQEVLWCGEGGQIFEPNTPPNTGNLFYLNPVQPLYKDGVTRLSDGTVLTMDLELNFNNKVTRYNPTTRVAAQVTTVPFNAGVDTRSAVLMPDGKVLTFGFGNIAAPGNTKVIQVYDPAANSWEIGMYTQTGPFRAPLMHVLPDSSVFAITPLPETAGTDKINRCWLLNKKTMTPAPAMPLTPALRLWPNPASAWLQIEGLPADMTARLTLYRPDGTVAAQWNEWNGRVSLAEKQLSAGWYFYCLDGNDGRTFACGKLSLN